MVDVGAGAPENYPADVAGRIVLVDYVAAQREQLVATAVAKGAAAVLFLSADLVYPRRAQAFSPTLPGSATAPVSIPSAPTTTASSVPRAPTTTGRVRCSASN
ncbi:MAG TPA: PA domain-containing protein [Jiangellales bacterium]|nr:PA domain-containing protein [Jiangellales bacterium]